MSRSKLLLWIVAAASALLMVALALLAGVLLVHLRMRPVGSGDGAQALPSPHTQAAAACAVERSAPFAFRSAEARDTLRVRIQGDPCSQARLEIAVQGPDGAELYRYQAPFPPHLGAEEARHPLPEAAAGFADEVLANAGIAGSTDQLPPWPDALAYYAAHKDALKLDEPAYEALRRVHRPLLWHATGAETWRSVVYDPQSHAGKVILSGGAP
jgi:hypothetical protein